MLWSINLTLVKFLPYPDMKAGDEQIHTLIITIIIMMICLYLYSIYQNKVTKCFT